MSKRTVELELATPGLDAQGRPMRECIKHAHFSEAWVRQGDG